MDSLDFIEMVMGFEEIFGVTIPDKDAERFGSPKEIVDWLELHLRNQRPNKEAIVLLQGVGVVQQHPELAEGLNGPWRREQIAAIVREILK